MTYILTLIISLILDQATKLYIDANISPENPVVLIDDFFQITKSYNTGGAFGIFSEHPEFFLVISGALGVAALLMSKKIMKLSFSWQFAIGSMVAGAMGNFIDRLRIGKVIDFIDFNFWPTFNVADISICVGVGLLVINMFIAEKRQAEKEKEDKEPGENNQETGPEVTGAEFDESADEREEETPVNNNETGIDSTVKKPFLEYGRAEPVEDEPAGNDEK